ncbi:MBL fold metallo-hydrolase [Maribellus sp. YY47]|uniref:ComEC/Rec2 family competence protein n=1 Tax=Maribellus sp. YY47 TaxID=2929486 RepID=UPI0020011042|nr:MBL fold metallo-hydrolase [Maribellus sp. YY47]MCK3685561.1 MBL fold metallo-hydrolase [Maribellus sp. YY47]
MLKKIVIGIFFFMVFLGCSQGRKTSNFVVWQLPSQVDAVGNSYVFRMNNGEVVIIDGGVTEEEAYLRGSLAALGSHVSLWLVSHPHPDHVGALTQIIKAPNGITIDKICHSELSESFCELEPDYKDVALYFYRKLKESGIPVDNLTEPGETFQVDHTKFKILSVKNESLTTNPYNNSSTVIRVWDDRKSILFLSDAGVEEGNLLLNGPSRKELDCDFLQMAHHGQRGVSKEFYRTIKFKACLWPTPTWVYNNNIGNGFNTHTLETIETRNLIDSLGITGNYVSCEGLFRIE